MIQRLGTAVITNNGTGKVIIALIDGSTIELGPEEHSPLLDVLKVEDITRFRLNISITRPEK